MTRPLTGIRADQKHSYRSIEAIAAGLRETLGLATLERFDAKLFFERQLADVTLKCRTGSVALREGVEECQQEGLTRWDPEDRVIEVVLSPTTYSMLGADHVRARSTVAHECGHAVLHTDQIIRLAGMSLMSRVAFHRDKYPHQACEDTEWQANAFGSALLMPAAGLASLSARVPSLTPAVVAATFGVSEESAFYRIETYGRSLTS